MAAAGTPLLELDEEQHAVKVLAEGLMIDLGGIGKGYAIDQMIELLREWSIESALVHSGQSSVFAMAPPPGRSAWQIDLRDPGPHEKSIGSVRLAHRAMSGSGMRLHGAHIIDPRTGQPAQGKLATWAAAPSAALADALSTAFMVMSPAEIETYCREHLDVAAMVMLEVGAKVVRFGEWPTA